MKLKKTENNNIQLIEAGKVIKSFTPAATLELTQEGKAVGLFYDGANVFDFYPTVITELEIAPDSATPFSGSVEDLLEELSNDFFFEYVGENIVTSNTVFFEQDENTTSTGAIWSTRHTFTGNLDVGTYQIDFFTYMGAGGAFANLQNGIRVNSVLEYSRGFNTFFVLEQAYPNTYLLEVTTAGAFTIEGQFRRVTAGITVDCNFSNMIIKKL